MSLRETSEPERFYLHASSTGENLEAYAVNCVILYVMTCTCMYTQLGIIHSKFDHIKVAVSCMYNHVFYSKNHVHDNNCCSVSANGR